MTLTHAFLPGMVERGRGGVITVASTAGMQPIPYETTYSASKAFARTFSDALSGELRGTGVKALCVNPGPVPTEWQEVAGYEPGYLPPVPGKISAEQVARESLQAFERGRRTLVPGSVIRWYMRINKPAPLPDQAARGRADVPAGPELSGDQGTNTPWRSNSVLSLVVAAWPSGAAVEDVDLAQLPDRALALDDRAGHERVERRRERAASAGRRAARRRARHREAGTGSPGRSRPRPARSRSSGR